MCRLFGFRSVVRSAVHRSLIEADNALGTQSEGHPDGWGVAYYIEGVPHLIRSAEKAGADHLFHRVGAIVSSETVVAHIRKATAGGTSILNSHPFQYGRWVFAHNGEIPRFDEVRSALLERVPHPLRAGILGETDSELMFALFLGALPRFPAPIGASAVRRALAEVERVVESTCAHLVDPKDLLLNFLVTDGSSLVASRRGKELYWSTYKGRPCPERGRCSSFAPECEAPTSTGRVNHLIVTSEPIGTENAWMALEDRQAVSVDEAMQLEVGPLEVPAQRLALIA